MKILIMFGLFYTWKVFKVLPHRFPFHIHTQLEPMTFCMEISVALKKRLDILVGKSQNLWNNSQIEIFVDMKNPLKIIEFGHKIMLENLVPLNLYLWINLEGENVKLGQ